MLPAVLLHVIEAPQPINTAGYLPAPHSPVRHMNDFVFFIQNVHNLYVSEAPQIIRLSA